MNGTVSQNAVIDAVDLPDPACSGAVGGMDHEIEKDGMLALTPDSYGSIDMGKSSTLHLESGEYFFEALDAGNKTIVIDIDLSSGLPISIHIMENLQLGNEIEILATNGEADSKQITFCTLQSSDVEIGNQAFFTGNLIAPNAKVILKKNSQLRGAVCADEIEVERDCLWLDHDAPGSLPGPGVFGKARDGERLSADGSPFTVYDFALHQNYPNPFNPTTVIRFQLPASAEVSLNIYNSAGQLVRTLVKGQFARGEHSVAWDARDESGELAASGVYIYEPRAGESQEFVSRKKLLFVK